MPGVGFVRGRGMGRYFWGWGGIFVVFLSMRVLFAEQAGERGHQAGGFRGSCVLPAC